MTYTFFSYNYIRRNETRAHTSLGLLSTSQKGKSQSGSWWAEAMGHACI